MKEALDLGPHRHQPHPGTHGNRGMSMRSITTRNWLKICLTQFIFIVVSIKTSPNNPTKLKGVNDKKIIKPQGGCLLTQLIITITEAIVGSISTKASPHNPTKLKWEKKKILYDMQF